MSPLSYVLKECLEGHREKLLNIDELVRELSPKVPAESIQDFMLFQKTIRDTKICEILYAADGPSKVAQETAKEKVFNMMRSAGVEKARANFTIDVITDALGWNEQSKEVAKPIPNKETQEKSSFDVSKILFGNRKWIVLAISVIIIACGYFFTKDNEKTILAETKPQLASNIKIDKEDVKEDVKKDALKEVTPKEDSSSVNKKTSTPNAPMPKQAEDVKNSDVWVYTDSTSGVKTYIIYDSVVYGRHTSFYAKVRIKKINQSNKVIESQRLSFDWGEGSWYYGIEGDNRGIKVSDNDEAMAILSWLQDHKKDAKPTGNPLEMVLR